MVEQTSATMKSTISRARGNTHGVLIDILCDDSSPYQHHPRLLETTERYNEESKDDYTLNFIPLFWKEIT